MSCICEVMTVSHRNLFRRYTTTTLKLLTYLHLSSAAGFSSAKQIRLLLPWFESLVHKMAVYAIKAVMYLFITSFVRKHRENIPAYCYNRFTALLLVRWVFKK